MRLANYLIVVSGSAAHPVANAKEYQSAESEQGVDYPVGEGEGGRNIEFSGAGPIPFIGDSIYGSDSPVVRRFLPNKPHRFISGDGIF